jgi:predicted dehydrogenase
MSRSLTRRQCLASTAVIGTGFWLESSRRRATAAANQQLDIAVIGVGGRGLANLQAVAEENVVALCDVDDQRAARAYELFPQAARFRDFRRLLDEMHQQIDAVVISTPDHTHFHPAQMAMRLGKHCYCEKPMAHSVQEVRTMTELARQTGVATQLGVQRHALSNVHRVVELVRAGAIGQVRECHAWIGGNRGMPPVPTDQPPVPQHLDWELWLGPASDRPYHPTYVPYGWRFWWDFGTGETGNWGCHVLDIPFWALDLDYPSRVDASGPPPHPQTSPRAMTTRFVFPHSSQPGTVTLHWYHAQNGPDVLRTHNLPNWKTGVLFVGDAGMLLSDFGRHEVYPPDLREDLAAPAKSIPDSPGFHREWIEACKGGSPATCNFEYSGPLTETVLLGNVAYRAGAGFDWDAGGLRARGNPKANALLRSEWRDGWQI